MVSINEKVDLVDQARDTTRAVSIYLRSDLSGTVTTLPENRRIKLTGIVGEGIAQIKEPVVGWVQSTYLKMPSSGLQKGKRYRLRDTPELSDGLSGYDIPGVKQNDGPVAKSIVHATDPFNSYIEGGRIFIRVFYTGKAGNERAGYVSQGSAGSVLGAPSSNLEAV